VDAELEFFATSGPMTDLDQFNGLLDDLPADPAGLVAIVQGLVLHRFWAEAYGVVATSDREDEVQIRSARTMISRILDIEPAPLVQARPPQARLFGHCRHFSTLTVALLRRAGVPSRARCGFANYFEEGKWVDHWVVEYWNGSRWVMVDSQVDEFQSEALSLRANPADLPPGFFLTAGQAWAKCRSGTEDPDRFGIFDMWGLWFVQGNVARDLAALNKVEMLPWDGWGALAVAGATQSDPEYVDEVAALTVSGDFSAIWHRYEADEALRVPSIVTTFLPGGPQQVNVPELAPRHAPKKPDSN